MSKKEKILLKASIVFAAVFAIVPAANAISEQYTPDEVAIYIIDFASMVLKNFETLNHVGGVVSSSEDEKLKNLFKMLWEEMETRKEKLLSVGVSSFVAYKEAGRTDMKQI